VAPILSAIKKAEKYIDILIFRLDWKEIENGLKAASKRGVTVRALIAHTNRGGEPKLRNLEMRCLDAGITVARTANDLVRYHGKMMIVDRKTLFLLSFNFVHLDIDHSRGFGICTGDAKLVKEAVLLFDADSSRKPYVPGHDGFVVSPLNARAQLSGFINKARKQLLIYDPKIGDPQIIRLLHEQARAGVDVRIIGSIAASKANLPVAPLTVMRLHTRTIIMDGKQAFIGSQSLRQLELESRREIGMIVHDAKIVNTLRETFEKDWESTGYEEPLSLKTQPDAKETDCEKDPTLALQKQMPPLATTVKHAIKQAVAKSRAEGLNEDHVAATVKGVVKEAVKAAVKELIHQDIVQET